MTAPRTEADFVTRDGPEKLRLRAVMPGLTVNDLNASLAFYRDILGFFVTREWGEDGGPRGAALKAGSIDLLLNQDDFKKGKNRKKGIGFRLTCQTAQDIDAMAKTIKSRGGTLDQEPTTHPWGMRDIALTDPDGFKLSIGNWNVESA